MNRENFKQEYFCLDCFEKRIRLVWYLKEPRVLKKVLPYTYIDFYITLILILISLRYFNTFLHKIHFNLYATQIKILSRLIVPNSTNLELSFNNTVFLSRIQFSYHDSYVFFPLCMLAVF